MQHLIAVNVGIFFSAYHLKLFSYCEQHRTPL